MSRARSFALLALAAACAPPQDRNGLERVLVAVTDATHAAHLSCYGNPEPTTPLIDEVAASGVRFSRAFSNNTWTLPSTASLMTGRLQESHGAVTNRHMLPRDERTLALAFSGAGYRTVAFVQMGYASGEFGMDRGFDEFHYYGESGEKGRGILPDAQGWLSAHADEPWFVYVHLRRPHSPYRPTDRSLAPLETGCPLAGESRDEEFAFADLFGARELPEDELAHVRHLYQGNVSMADSLLRPIVVAARKQGALIVLTSDHGEALGQHGVFGHGGHLYAESIDIPLVFSWPGAEPRVDDGPASTIDVFPTLLELCGIDAAGGAVDPDGTSLVPRLHGREAKDSGPVMISARYTPSLLPRIGVIDGDWKLVWDGPDAVALYDRRGDPEDTRDRSAEEPEVTARLAARAGDWRRRHAEAAGRGILLDEVDPAVEADLRAIGYGGE